MVTIPGLFRSQTNLGTFEAVIYKLIPYEEDSSKPRVVDEEQPTDSSAGEGGAKYVKRKVGSLLSPKTFRSKFPSHYSSLFDLLELMFIPARWVHLLLFHILKQLFPMIERLEKQKKTHKETLELIEFLAYHPDHMEFYSKGRRKGKEKSPLAGDNTTSGTEQSPPSTDAGEGQGVNGGGNRDKAIVRLAEKLFMYMSHKDANHEAAAAKDLQKSMKEAMEELSGESTIRRWDEPPLILGAQMGLPEFVRSILLVRPQAAAYLDTKGRSVLQVAVMYRREEIVKIIMDMRTILPSWLFSEIEPKTGNTILHLASDGSPDVAKKKQDEPDSMELHYDLVWFEVKLLNLFWPPSSNSLTCFSKVLSVQFFDMHSSVSVVGYSRIIQNNQQIHK
nr:PREDICTED: uncharacterized protein LOC108951177 [Musa acuminata subsp. malaccensis]